MAVADVLVSKVLDMLISTIGKGIEQEVRLVVGVKKQKNMLANNLQSIQVVLVDAERRQWKDASVQLWVDRLKDVSYDIEDVLDEWGFAIIKSQRERDAFASKPKRKVWSFILSPCFCFREVGFRRDIALKITELNERLDRIAKEKDNYGFLSLKGNDEQVDRPVTTSVIDISEVKGREVEKEKLMKLLLAEDGEKPKLHPIAIVGMGGIGKTTLAKLVYNDERLKTHFHKRIWVCVSDPFDEIKIAREIIEFLGGSPNLASPSKVMEKLQQSIEGKKVLIVFDDVWNEDPEKCKQLADCLKSSSLGSRVLITTRNENVGRIMGCLESNILRVGLLSVEESWELFCMIAFSRKSNQEIASLEGIGREVVQKCKRLPLAIRAIAGLLQFKISRMEWKSVLDSELWDLEELQRDIVAPLWLSYYDLPSHLKQCFSYCAVFPKDYRMEKGELVKLWISQGYIKETKSRDMEMLGGEYFQNLVMRSLFQDFEVEKGRFNVGRAWCKMHDIVHDLASLLVKKECLSLHFTIYNEEVGLDNNSIGNVLRHLGITFTSGVWFVDSFYNLKKLRSLVVLQSKDSPGWLRLDLQKIFDLFTSLRSLKLVYCDIRDVPENINRLIHLRELDLSGNRGLKELPDAVWELYNLQILSLRECVSLKSFKGIGRLINLRHLENEVGRLPKEVVRLSGLRRINLICLDFNDEAWFSLKHLKNFNKLGGSLKIRWLNQLGDGDVEEAKEAHLKDKIYISDLQLDFGSQKRETKQDEELVEALGVPPNLEILTINYYMGLRTPNWFDSLTVVKMVELDSWWECEHLPPFGKLPCLEDLRLRCFNTVRKVGAEFLGMNEMMLSSTILPLFPKLKSLFFEAFLDWEEWSDANVDEDDEKLIMPSLTYLEMKFCSKLKVLPGFILKKVSLEMNLI